MPELPEVETIRRQLQPKLVDATIVDAWTFGTPKFEDAPSAIGSQITYVGRLGKYLVIGLRGPEPGEEESAGELSAAGDRELIVHLGMTGRLAVVAKNSDTSIDVVDIDRSEVTGSDFHHQRATWSLSDGRTLVFDDVRRFGRIAVVDAGDYASLPTLAALGPEPFDDAFTPEALRDAVNGSRRAVKTQLLSQRPVAGVGNIYADEALWLAGVHPRSQRLTRAKAELLRDAIRKVLEDGIADGGTTLRNYRDADGGSGEHQDRLLCYGRAGLACHRCGATLRRIVIDARSTTYCPVCQRR